MKVSNIRYKLTDQNMKTFGGFQWEFNVWKVAKGNSTLPCTDGVLHAYTDPRLAIIFNPAHANIKNPRLFKIEIDSELGTDGQKIWCKKQKIVEELIIPNITIEEKIAFALYCVEFCNPSTEWLTWATNWMLNIDRTAKAATDIAYAAYAIAYAANAAATAAYAATYAANAAAYATTYAAYAAANAADAAANAADAKNNSIDFNLILHKVFYKK